MRDYLTLGPTPSDEKCSQVGTDNYVEQSKKECTAYVHQLERLFTTAIDSKVPEDCYFGIKRFDHDFGSYREVVIYYDSDNEESSNFAFNVENNCPANWDDEAKKELNI